MDETESLAQAPAAISNALFQNVLDRLTYLEALTEAQKAEIDALQATHTSKSEPKIADPEHFDGNRLQLPNFLAKCRLKFSGQPSRFRSEKSKIYYAGSRLAEPAFSWFQPLLAMAEDPEKPTPTELTSFQTFAESLMSTYGDPNLEATSERAIKALIQTTSVAQYKAEFQRLRQYIKWNESALLDRFYSGLKDTVKDEITRVGRPLTLKELQDLATRIDARLYERLLEKKQGQSQATGSRNNLPPKPTPMARNPSQSSTFSGLIPTPSRTPSPATPLPSTPAATPDGTIPMELDANGRWHLTEGEKLRRKRLGLCDYCGSTKHNVFNCPDKPAPNYPRPPRFARQTEISFEITSPEDPSKDNAQE
jgi:hypothetical protein